MTDMNTINAQELEQVTGGYFWDKWLLEVAQSVLEIKKADSFEVNLDVERMKH